MITKDTQHASNLTEIPEEMMVAILKVVHPEKILCFGKRSRETEAWSCFLQLTKKQTSTIYDLLIITRPDEKRNRHEILDMIDGFNTPTIMVHALVHNIITVNEALGSGSIFFTTIFESGLLLYDNQSIPLIAPIQRSRLTDTATIIESIWNKWFGLAQQFLKGASYFSSFGWNNLAAFMLHQAVEHTCIALIRVITGYRATTHNLSRLMAMTGNFTEFSRTIFPRNTRQEIDLFQVLTSAYSDVRYKEGFKVATGEIPILIERVTSFQYQAECLYQEKLLKISMAPSPPLSQTNKEFKYENSQT